SISYRQLHAPRHHLIHNPKWNHQVLALKNRHTLSSVDSRPEQLLPSPYPLSLPADGRKKGRHWQP
ncbi:hypothetical protein ACVGXN_00635, partial [Enterobacter hormaechei]